MTLFLKEVDVEPEVKKFRSALIVVCRFCPATSLSLRKGRPYIELFRRFLNTGPYEEYINDLRRLLEDDGVSTGVFRGNLLNFIICMWTSGQRKRLLKRAQKYEAIVVLGCDVAYQTICNILEPTNCHVIHGMECEGILDAAPRFHFPCNISLDLIGVTPLEGKSGD